MIGRLTNLWRDEEGQGMAEYGLIIALVALVAAIGLTAFGGFLNGFFTDLKDEF
ncbi:MAG: Flp family type IVb pilin [Bacillota bacterium]|nr:Flp family type IVb pilin [Bacillota bacterium]MDD3298231.1 Flp family type IVb pilin [Bacillota bacterium]MDD3851885.1 Flp family type IVb pilin [Bacillota bacterium]MDD4707794.1 Flp family type IVb pilin [Bacillota bacterium]